MSGPWDEAQALVGTVLAQATGADPVSATDIRRKLEVIALDSPVHTDEDCARENGYRTTPAPVSMTRVWSVPEYWAPGEERPRDAPMSIRLVSVAVPGPGDTTLATHLRCEHREPLYPGDRVTAKAVLCSVTPKTTRVGDGAFIVVETTYTNQDGAIVSIETATVFRFNRGDA